MTTSSTVVKHEDHDQSSHGNWAIGRGVDEAVSLLNMKTVSQPDRDRLMTARRFRPTDAGFTDDQASQIMDDVTASDIPGIMYHVAPRSARSSIDTEGLYPRETWNTGAGGGVEYRNEALWDNSEGEAFPFEYRPEGVYLFREYEAAVAYRGSSGKDIYAVNAKGITGNGGQIIRDPVLAHNWDYLLDSEQTFVTRVVPSSLLQRIEGSDDSVVKHGDHDQSSHGNWAKGMADDDAVGAGPATKRFKKLTAEQAEKAGYTESDLDYHEVWADAERAVYLSLRIGGEGEPDALELTREQADRAIEIVDLLQENAPLTGASISIFNDVDQIVDSMPGLSREALPWVGKGILGLTMVRASQVGLRPRNYELNSGFRPHIEVSLGRVDKYFDKAEAHQAEDLPAYVIAHEWAHALSYERNLSMTLSGVRGTIGPVIADAFKEWKQARDVASNSSWDAALMSGEPPKQVDAAAAARAGWTSYGMSAFDEGLAESFAVWALGNRSVAPDMVDWGLKHFKWDQFVTLPDGRIIPIEKAAGDVIGIGCTFDADTGPVFILDDGVAKHMLGDHDQSSHGNWAPKYNPAGATSWWVDTFGFDPQWGRLEPAPTEQVRLAAAAARHMFDEGGWTSEGGAPPHPTLDAALAANRTRSNVSLYDGTARAQPFEKGDVLVSPNHRVLAPRTTTARQAATLSAMNRDIRQYILKFNVPKGTPAVPVGTQGVLIDRAIAWRVVGVSDRGPGGRGLVVLEPSEVVVKHGDHDQLSHGNWARGRSGVPKALLPEEAKKGLEAYEDGEANKAEVEVRLGRRLAASSVTNAEMAEYLRDSYYDLYYESRTRPMVVYNEKRERWTVEMAETPREGFEHPERIRSAMEMGLAFFADEAVTSEQRLALSRVVVDSVVDEWSKTSNKTPSAAAAQMAAQDEFGLAAAENQAAPDMTVDWYDKHGALLRAVIRSQYEETQEFLRDRFPGHDSVVLFRGGDSHRRYGQEGWTVRDNVKAAWDYLTGAGRPSTARARVTAEMFGGERADDDGRLLTYEARRERLTAIKDAMPREQVIRHLDAIGVSQEGWTDKEWEMAAYVVSAAADTRIESIERNPSEAMQPRGAIRSTLTGRPMMSFSTDPQVGIGFFGGMKAGDSSDKEGMMAVVPFDRILSTVRTGYGATDEEEWVVLGGRIRGLQFTGMDYMDIRLTIDRETSWHGPSLGSTVEEFITIDGRPVPVFKHEGGGHDQSTHGNWARGRKANLVWSRDPVQTINQALGVQGERMEQQANQSGINKTRAVKAVATVMKDKVLLSDMAAMIRGTGQIHLGDDAEIAFFRDSSNQDRWGVVFSAPGMMEGRKKMTPELVVLDESNPDHAQMAAEYISDVLVKSWAKSSNADAHSIAAQMAARDEFGITDAAPASGSAEIASSLGQRRYEQYGSVYRGFLRAMYETTQATLRDAFPGKDALVLYRGGDSDRRFLGTGTQTEEPFRTFGSTAYYARTGETLVGRPMQSFTYSAATAEAFTDKNMRMEYVMGAVVPFDRILSTVVTGYGATDEYEMVVLGGKITGTRVPAQAMRPSGNRGELSGEMRFNRLMYGVEAYAGIEGGASLEASDEFITIDGRPVPLFKHMGGKHNQKTHGRWAWGGIPHSNQDFSVLENARKNGHIRRALIRDVSEDGSHDYRVEEPERYRWDMFTGAANHFFRLPLGMSASELEDWKQRIEATRSGSPATYVTDAEMEAMIWADGKTEGALQSSWNEPPMAGIPMTAHEIAAHLRSAFEELATGRENWADGVGASIREKADKGMQLAAQMEYPSYAHVFLDAYRDAVSEGLVDAKAREYALAMIHRVARVTGINNLELLNEWRLMHGDKPIGDTHPAIIYRTHPTEGMRARADEYLSRARVAVAVPIETAEAVIRDGALKNQYQSRTSGGMYKPSMRRVYEEAYLGVAVDAPASERPVYGYLYDPLAKLDDGPGQPEVDQYGSVRFVLKRKVHERTTFVHGDTLDDRVLAVPLTGELSAEQRLRARVDTIGMTEREFYEIPYRTSRREPRDIPMVIGYKEAQVYNGVSLDDVERVYIEASRISPYVSGWTTDEIVGRLLAEKSVRRDQHQEAEQVRGWLSAAGRSDIRVFPAVQFITMPDGRVLPVELMDMSLRDIRELARSVYESAAKVGGEV